MVKGQEREWKSKLKTNESSLISVIIPVYNAEQYLEKCLDSVVGQTHTNLEIILVDDASTDASGDICDTYVKRDSRIRVIHLESNQGVSHARNVGMDYALGTYLGFVDADDYIEQNMYELLCASILRNQADISVCEIDCMGFGEYTDRKQIERAHVLSADQAVYYMLQAMEGGYSVENKLFVCDFVRKYRFHEKISCGEDILFLYKVMRHSRRVSYLPEQLYHYIFRESSGTHRSFQLRQYTQSFVYEFLYREVEKYYPDLLPRMRRQILDVNIRLAVSAVESNMVKGRKLYCYLRRFRTNIRNYISLEALKLFRCKKIAAEVVLLYFSAEIFWGSTVLYKKIREFMV
ncbi:MAG: glycosyltransferase [Hespellia sp.]|nr:glycosyltransferase [Hespellia sp.]